MTTAKKKSRGKLIWIILVILVVAGAGTAYGLRKREKPITVQTEKVGRRNITEVVVANGKIQPVLQVTINPEVSGEIIELPVKEGQTVKKGDLLVKLKPDNYQASRNSADANYKSSLANVNLAQANLDKAVLEFKRYERLYGDKLVSDSDYLSAKTSWDVQKATYETSTHGAAQAKAALAKAEDELAKTIIYSPMDGTITKLRSQMGERVVGTAMMAGTEVMNIANLEVIEARVDIGEVDIPLIATGQVVRIEIEAYRNKKFGGIVTDIANASKNNPTGNSAAANSTSSGGTAEATKFEVRIRVKDQGIFRPGMSVTAEIESRSRTNVLAVPLQSVTTRMAKKPDAGKMDEQPKSDENKPKAFTKVDNKPAEVVFKMDGDKVKLTPVKTGISDDGYVELTEGLNEGEVIVSGGYKAVSRELEDGKAVKIEAKEDKKPSTPGT